MNTEIQSQTTENTPENPSSDVLDTTVTVVPNIEEDVVIPNNAYEALPPLSTEQELNARASTIKALSDITGEEILVDADNIHAAEEVAKQMIEDKNLRPDYAVYPNETIAFLAGLVSQTNHMIVKNLSDLKLYVVNNLVRAVETTDNTKEKIAGLRAIGEIDGVDAFKKKTEVTHKVETMQEVEKELLEMLRTMKAKALQRNSSSNLANRVAPIDAEYTHVANQDKK